MFTLELARAHINQLHREAARDARIDDTRTPGRLRRLVARGRSAH